MRHSLLTLALIVSSWPATSTAQDPRGPELVRVGKRATALVESGDVIASAFCIDPAGLFVTNAHHLEAAGDPSQVKLVLNAGETDQEIVEARVLRSDKQADLALIAANTDMPLSALALGPDVELFETMDVIAFGYPFGKGIALGVGEYPNVSVNTGRITSLRKRDGKLNLIQLDVTLNPGDSGGPVLDGEGKVIGVVQFGLRGAGMNYAIPVSRLAAFLAEPVVLFDPLAPTEADRGRSVDWTIHVLAPGRAAARLNVEILLGEPGRARRFPAKDQGEGRYVASVVPLPPEAEAKPVDVTVEFESGRIQGRIPDHALDAGDKKILISRLLEIRNRPKAEAILPEGDAIPIRGGLGTSLIDLGGVRVEVDLARADRISVHPSQTGIRELPCTVVVREGEKVVAEYRRTLDLGGPGRVAAAAGLEIRPAPGLEDKVVRKLPGTITDVVAGGGGRYLLVVLKDIRKLAVFDVTTADVVRLLPLASSEVMVAAGAEKLFLFYPDQKVVQRWRLGSFEREATRPMPFDGVIKAVAMGSSSTGPILVHWGVGSGQLDQAPICFLDPSSLKVVTDVRATQDNGMAGQGLPDGTIRVTHYSSYRDVVHWRASGNGSVFAAWCTSHSPSGVFAMAERGGVYQLNYLHDTAGHVVPGPDGRTIYTGFGSLYDEELKAVHRSVSSGMAFFPAADDAYFLGVRGLYPRYEPPAAADAAARDDAHLSCSIFLAGGSSPILTLPPLSELGLPQGAQEEWIKDDFTLDKRLHFIPAADLLVTVPRTNDHLVVRKVDVLDSLARAGRDYLFVTSRPPRGVARGQSLAYQLEIRSRRGGVRCVLQDGPEGLEVSPTGRVTWAVPVDYEGGDPFVVISVTDASGLETFHNFEIRVR